MNPRYLYVLQCNGTGIRFVIVWDYLMSTVGAILPAQLDQLFEFINAWEYDV